MFDSLKKKLKESAKKLAEKVSAKEDKEEVKKPVKKKPAKKIKPKEKIKKPVKKEPKPVEEKPIEEVVEEPEAEEIVEEPEAEVEEEVPETEVEEEIIEEKKEKRGFFKRIREKELSGSDIDNFFKDIEMDLLQSNVALEVIDAFKENLKKELADKPIKRGKVEETIEKAFEASLAAILKHKEVNLEKLAKEKKPLSIVFVGVNGSGKTTTIAKLAKWFQGKGLKPVLAAGDTFRAASIEQLEHHGEKLDAPVIKHQYGSDSAAVVFDAIKHAEARGLDVVLADTAGRIHANTNLMDELKKVIRVNKPDLKILVMDSLTGNDTVEQAKSFHDAVGVDGIIFTKIDVNKKGGSVLSACWAIKKPVLFLGTGQEYSELVKFEPEKFVKELI